MLAATLAGDGVRLVPYDQRFDEQTVAWLNDPELARDFGLTYVVTLESHRRWFLSQPDLLMWAIHSPDDQHHGNCSLQVTRRHASAYLQIYIGSAASRGRGLGWAALSALLDHAFGVLGLHRVWLHQLPSAVAAAGLYRKAGFREEGIERESVLRDRHFDSQLRLSILADEWIGRDTTST